MRLTKVLAIFVWNYAQTSSCYGCGELLAIPNRCVPAFSSADVGHRTARINNSATTP